MEEPEMHTLLCERHQYERNKYCSFQAYDVLKKTKLWSCRAVAAQGWEKGRMDGAWRTFRAVKMFCMLPQWRMYVPYIYPNPQNAKHQEWTLRYCVWLVCPNVGLSLPPPKNSIIKNFIYMYVFLYGGHQKQVKMLLGIYNLHIKDFI